MGKLYAHHERAQRVTLGDLDAAVAQPQLEARAQTLECSIKAAYGGEEDRRPFTINGQRGQAADDRGGGLSIRTIQTKVCGPAERLTAEQLHALDVQHAKALMDGPRLDEGVKPLPKPKPRASCGQIWKRGREMFEIVDEEPGRGVQGFWRMRRQDDGEERDVNALDLRDDSWEHVSGGQETKAEAILRTCRREMAKAPVGCDPLRWRCVVAALRERAAVTSEVTPDRLKYDCGVARLALEVRHA